MNQIQKWLDSESTRPRDLDEYKIVLVRAGYRVGIHLKRFVSNGDGTERATTVKRCEFDTREHDAAHLAELLEDTRIALRHSIDKARLAESEESID